MNTSELTAIAQAMVAPGKGILAADESNATITKRFQALGITSTPDTRRDYRETLLAAPGLSEHVSGVILYDETFRQSTAAGVPFTDLLRREGILPGIKVDTGAKPLAGSAGETVTEGLDGLRERVAEYHEKGARFAKWRAVINIDDASIPTRAGIVANAHALARYAAICQEGGIVPIVEAEVLMDGGHTLERCDAATEAALLEVFAQLAEQHVLLEGIVLKPNMVVAGKKSARQGGVEEVAAATVRVLNRTVPAAVPGIAFLSGGQSAELATAHLNAMNAMGPHPWRLTFSYGRALQDPALAGWAGSAANVEKARTALLHRAACNGAALSGHYTDEMERAA